MFANYSYVCFFSLFFHFSSVSMNLGLFKQFQCVNCTANISEIFFDIHIHLKWIIRNNYWNFVSLQKRNHPIRYAYSRPFNTLWPIQYSYAYSRPFNIMTAVWIKNGALNNIKTVRLIEIPDQRHVITQLFGKHLVVSNSLENFSSVECNLSSRMHLLLIG